MNTWLTGEQQDFLKQLDGWIRDWPNRKPERIHLRPRQFNAFRIIAKKKERWPESNGHIEIDGDKYKGVQIVPLNEAKK